MDLLSNGRRSGQRRSRTAMAVPTFRRSNTLRVRLTGSFRAPHARKLERSTSVPSVGETSGNPFHAIRNTANRSFYQKTAVAAKSKFRLKFRC